MQLINLEALNNKLRGKDRIDQKIILNEEYPKYREKLKKYYESSIFRDMVTRYIHEIYYPYIKNPNIITNIDTSKIEFGFSVNTLENFINTIIGRETVKKGKIIFEIEKPSITARNLFFKNLQEFFNYCITELPPDMFAGAVWEEDKIKYRHLVFDFDYKGSWKEALIVAIYTMYFSAYIFGIKKFYMYRSGLNGVHLYPATLTSLVYHAQRDSSARGFLVDLLSSSYNYAEILIEPFVICKNIYDMKDTIKNSLKVKEDRCEISFNEADSNIINDIEEFEEFYRYQKSLGLMNSESRAKEMRKIRKFTPSAFYIEKTEIIEDGISKIENKERLILDVAVAKDMRRMIRIPGSIHPISYLSVDPIYFNNMREISIVAGKMY